MRRASLAAAMLAASGLFASMGAGVSLLRAPDIGMPAEITAKPSRPSRRKRYCSGTRWFGQGEQERARRRRQIAAGQLTAANGLIV